MDYISWQHTLVVKISLKRRNNYMFGFFKLILVAIIGIIIAGIVFFSSIFNGETISKDSIINTYDSFLQDTSINGLTKDKKLEGKKRIRH